MSRYNNYMIRSRSSIKPGFETLNGKIMELEIIWEYDISDLYPEEKALGNPKKGSEAYKLFKQLGIHWIASGDTVRIRRSQC